MLNIYYFWNVSVFNEIIAIPNSLCRYFSTLSKLISQCMLTGSVCVQDVTVVKGHL